jgi:hypothetical protein
MFFGMGFRLNRAAGRPTPCCRRQILDIVQPRTQKTRDLHCRCVPKAHLNDLRRMTSHESPSQKVIVFGDDDELFGFGEGPDTLVIFAGQSDIPHVATAGKTRQQHFNESERKILIE